MNVLSLIVLKGDIHKDYDKGRVSQIVTKKRSTKRNEKREFLVVEFYTPEKSFLSKIFDRVSRVSQRHGPATLTKSAPLFRCSRQVLFSLLLLTSSMKFVNQNGF